MKHIQGEAVSELWIITSKLLNGFLAWIYVRYYVRLISTMSLGISATVNEGSGYNPF